MSRRKRRTEKRKVINSQEPSVMKGMREIGKLQGIAPGDAQSLRQKNVVTVDDLWHCVGVDFDRGITKVADETTVSKEVLYSLLIADSIGDVRQRIEVRPFRLWLGLKPLWILLKGVGRFLKQVALDWRRHWAKLVELWFGLKLSWLIPKRFYFGSKRLWHVRHGHWLEAVLGVSTLLLVILTLRAGLIRYAMTDQVAVKSGVHLSPLRSIRAEDVLLKLASGERSAITSPAQVIGRYPVETIEPGTILRDEHLMAEEMSRAMNGRLVLSVPVNSKSLSPTLKPPVRVWLLLSPRASGEKGPQPLLVKDVILISINQRGETSSVGLAIKEDDLKSIEALLGLADVFVLQATA
jgi:hypothetical protein